MFSHLLRQMPVYLVGDAKRMVWSKRPAMLLVLRDVKYNAFDLINEIFESFNSIWNVFPELHNFLIFTDSVTTNISSRSSQPRFRRKKHRRTFSWSGEHPSQNYWNGITEIYLLNTFGNPSLQILAAGKASLVNIESLSQESLSFL